MAAAFSKRVEASLPQLRFASVIITDGNLQLQYSILFKYFGQNDLWTYRMNQLQGLKASRIFFISLWVFPLRCAVRLFHVKVMCQNIGLQCSCRLFPVYIFFRVCHLITARNKSLGIISLPSENKLLDPDKWWMDGWIKPTAMLGKKKQHKENVLETQFLL